MHPHASLGPIDPQITISGPDGKQKKFAYEDVGAFLRFLETEVRVTEQAHVSAIVEKLFSVVDPVQVGAAKRASELSSSVGERLLLMHMSGEENRGQAKQLAENLNKSFFAHGDAISRTRAKELHLSIADEDEELERLIWQAYLGLESYMELRKPFSHIQNYLADPTAAAAVRPIPPVAIAPNTPPPIAQQIWQAVMQQAIQSLTNPAVEVDYSFVAAVLEGVREASEYRTRGKVSAYRNAAGEIQLAVVDTSLGWSVI